MKWLLRIIVLLFLLCILSFIIQCIQIHLTAVKSTETPECSGNCIAVTLGAAVWTNRPSPVFKERINESIKLYKRNIVQTLIFTGALAQGDKISEAMAAKEYAINAGVNPEDILIEEQSSNTWENILFTRNLLKNKSYDQLFIVSDPYHLRRALNYSRAFDLTAQGVGTQSSRYQSFQSKAKFLFKEAYLLLTHQTADAMIKATNGID